MDLDRGALAKIDRKVLSRLGHDERYQMVRMPVSEALWSTWKRYCAAVGISMGRAVAALVEHELRSVVMDSDAEPLFLAQLENRLGERNAALDARERSLEVRERWLRERERQVRVDPVPARPPVPVPRVGRNEPCPCGSGVKYKRCHGS